MKSCPTCNRTYPDDTLAFCLVDGSILSAPYDPEATQSFSFPPSTEPTNVAKTIPSSSQPLFSPDTKQNDISDKRGAKRGLIFGIVILLVLTAGLILGLGWSAWFSNKNAEARQSNNESINNNSLAKTTPTIRPTATPQITPSPKSTPLVVKKIDITGNWSGVFANRDAILFINSQDGDSFSGILKNSKKAMIAISGHINPDTRQISIQENRVIEEATDGPAWILGMNSGSLSADGKRMNGTGKDKAGHSYSWTFSK